VTDDQIEAMSARTSGSGQSVNVRLVGYDRPFFTAAALAISIMSAFYAFEAGREAQQEVYWLQRSEAFLEQLSAQGIHVPPDLLNHKEK
jgi:hypothetical protein